MAKGPWPVGQRCHWNGEQPFCGASLGQAFDTLLSPLLCPFTDEETEALKANQQGHAALRGGGRGCWPVPHLWSLLARWDSPGGAPPNPSFFYSFTLLSSCVYSPLASCLLPSHPWLCPAHTHGRPDHCPKEQAKRLFSPLPFLCPPRPPSSCISSPARHPEAGEEERPEEAGQGWPD